MFKIPKIGKWQYFCNILRKIVATALCSITIKTFIYFTGVQSCSLLLADMQDFSELDSVKMQEYSLALQFSISYVQNAKKHVLSIILTPTT